MYAETSQVLAAMVVTFALASWKGRSRRRGRSPS